MATLPKAPTTDFTSTTLNGNIDNAVLTIAVNNAGNIQTPTYAVIDRLDANSLLTPNAREVVYISSKSSNDLTVTRGANNSTARSHNSGAILEPILSVGQWADLYTVIDQEHGTDGTHDTAVVTTLTATQTLTNKTLTSPVINTSISGTAIVDEDNMASDSDTKVPTQQSVKAYVDTNASPADGWKAITDTLTYASATTFTIAGVDRTTTYTKGTRIKLTQTSAKYYVVVGSSFSTDTTVTVTGGTDYTIANAAITSPYYSYQASPQGFPGFFNYTPTFTGFSGTPTSVGKFYIIGNLVHLSINTVASTSNATGFTATLPVTVATVSNYLTAANGQGQDNGTATIVYGYVSSAGTVITFQKTVGVDASWTGSGNKSVTFQFSYQI